MSDEADLAQEHIEAEQAMRRRYAKPAQKEFEETGLCLNCAQPVAPTNRWCDKDCMQDHTNRMKSNGRK